MAKKWCPICCGDVDHDSSIHGSIKVFSVEPDGKRIFSLKDGDEAMLPKRSLYDGSNVANNSVAFSIESSKKYFYDKAGDSWVEKV